jgi:bifunctional DNA-binding transcriptional regulator/antitoxin component of YhaV-PrlF toxin-antitoxin module
MKLEENIILEDEGKITLPDDVRSRYGLSGHTPIRIIETRTGILLVPLSNEPMSQALASELEDWQALGQDSLSMFPYDEDKQT